MTFGDILFIFCSAQAYFLMTFASYLQRKLNHKTWYWHFAFNFIQCLFCSHVSVVAFEGGIKAPSCCRYPLEEYLKSKRNILNCCIFTFTLLQSELFLHLKTLLLKYSKHFVTNKNFNSNFLKFFSQIFHFLRQLQQVLKNFLLFSLLTCRNEAKFLKWKMQ